MIRMRSVGGLLLVVGACIAGVQVKTYSELGSWLPFTISDLSHTVLGRGLASLAPAMTAWLGTVELAAVFAMLGVLLILASPLMQYLNARKFAKIMDDYRAEARRQIASANANMLPAEEGTYTEAESLPPPETRVHRSGTARLP